MAASLWNGETDQSPRRGFLGRLRESQIKLCDNNDHGNDQDHSKITIMHIGIR